MSDEERGMPGVSTAFAVFFITVFLGAAAAFFFIVNDSKPKAPTSEQIEQLTPKGY